MLTQQQIARDLGLSYMTVSRCLNGKGNVSEKTRRRIEEYIAKRRYRRNLIARSLVTGKSRIVGLLVPSIAYSYYPEIIARVQETVRAREYNVALCVSNEDPDQEAEELDMLLGLPVDGIVLCPTSSPKSRENCARLLDNETPFALFDRYFPDLSCSYVTTDSESAARELTERLIALGHRRIARLNGPPENSFARQVAEGCRQALTAAGLSASPKLEVATTLSVDGGEKAMEKLFARGAAFTAVQAVNDLVAFGAARALKARGLRVPEDISLVGFSDIGPLAWPDVPLTTVREPTAEMGEKVALALLDQLEGAAKGPVRLALKGELVIRNSCRPAGGENFGVKC